MTKELLNELDFEFMKKRKAKKILLANIENLDSLNDKEEELVLQYFPREYTTGLYNHYKSNYETIAIPDDDSYIINNYLDNIWIKFLLNRFQSNLPDSLLSLRPNDMYKIINRNSTMSVVLDICKRYFTVSPETFLKFDDNANDDINLRKTQKRILNNVIFNSDKQFYKKSIMNYIKNGGEPEPIYNLLSNINLKSKDLPNKPLEKTPEPNVAPNDIVSGNVDLDGDGKAEQIEVKIYKNKADQEKNKITNKANVEDVYNMFSNDNDIFARFVQGTGKKADAARVRNQVINFLGSSSRHKGFIENFKSWYTSKKHSPDEIIKYLHNSVDKIKFEIKTK